jgi:tetratricopeptide (TPR) repeat protein
MGRLRGNAMRRIPTALALALTLAALPAWAQRPCLSDDPDIAIRACTIDIVSPPDPKDVASSYVSRGRAYLKKGRGDQAMADFEKAIGIDPESAAAYGNLGLIYYDMGRYDLALADLTKAIELAGPDAHSIDYLRRGVAYEASGERDKAMADYRSALKLDPDDAESKKGLQRLGSAP